MSYTTITVKKEVYDKLKKVKGDESFSDFLERVVLENRGTNFLKSAGVLKDMPDKEFEAMKKDMAALRRNFKVRS